MPDITVEDLIRQEAQKAGIPEALALAVAEQESGFNPTVLGPKLPSGEQAVGTFQILPSTAKLRGFDPTDPVQNIRGGIGYLRDLLDQHNGDLESVLKEYGGVKTDQTYVPGVLGRLKKFGESSTPPPTAEPGHTATGESLGPLPPVGPVEPPPVDQSLLGSLKSRLQAAGAPNLAQRVLDTYGNVAQQGVDAVQGFGRAAVNSSTRMMDLARQKLLGLPGERPAPYGPETTPAGKVGAALEPAAEFGVAGTAAAGVAPALGLTGVAGTATSAATQAATARALTKAQGGSDTAANINAALAGTGPVVEKAMQVGAAAIRAKAESQLSRVFATGLENRGPMVDYALKTGEAGTPEVAKAADIVRKAASQTLDLPIQASWGKWQTTLAKDVAAKGQTLQQALEGPMGSIEVPKQAVIDSLDQLLASTKHIAEMPTGDFAEMTFNPKLAQEVDVLKKQLGTYGDYITVRNLTDIKRVWDDYVYTLSTAGKVGINNDALVTTAMKKAVLEGANGIRAALQEHAPDVARLNEAVTDAIRLQDLTAKLYAANPSMAPAMKNLATAMGFGVGALALRGTLPGMTGAILGSHLGGATARLVINAMESPLWQTLKPSALKALSEALASGNADAVRRIVTPLVAAKVTAAGSAPAVPSTAPSHP